ncbi:MAG: CDP-glycerol glycerophosphotransferase family protein [Spirochaetia bacterium]|nr:CDP-glycerol glycerophosphotransferase family protein [Spirochaetia bacterium]
MLKFLFKIATWLALHIFYILPVKENQIFFRAFHGKKYDCNPKYLFLYMLKKYGDSYTYIWELGDAGQVINGASSVRRLSIKSFMAMMTSKYIVTNNDFMWWIPLRRSQVMLETWHGGGAYKRVGLYEKWSRLMLLDQKWNARQVTYYISSSRKFTEVQAPSKWVPEEKFINTGMPRNEVFFYPEKVTQLREKVFAHFGLRADSDIKIVLYAPTYRGLTGYKGSGKDIKITPDYKALLEALGQKYGGRWVLFFRSHYFDSSLTEQLPDSVVDATKYEDMQELLCAADVLVTDFSSSIWDFGLTKKPCFLFASDLQQYIADRGFYTDPFTWPFPMAQNDGELSRNILSFDETTYKKAVQKHLTDFGSYENKDACAKVCQAIGITG